jgi:hypothetical protein
VFRSITPFYLLVALLGTTLPVAAQTPANPPEDQPGQAPTDKKQLSSHITAALREKLPAYSPTEKKEPEPVQETAGETVILEKRVVRGDKTHTFSEHELANKKGLAALLLKRYPGASVPIGSNLPNYAALMLAEDERLEHIAQLESVADNLRATGDIKASKELKNEISRTYIRGHDWKTESMDRSANHNRR